MNYNIRFQNVFVCSAQNICVRLMPHSAQNSKHNGCLHCCVGIADQFNLTFNFFLIFFFFFFFFFFFWHFISHDKIYYILKAALYELF